MANLICRLYGVRGRSMEVYDSKCIIKTEATAGSLLTGNATDGEKTIFYMDCAGVQFKECKATIGFLQLETPSMQMNNQASNFWSENTFTFEEGKNNITNRLMREVYNFICDRIEGYKCRTNMEPLTEAPESLASALKYRPEAAQSSYSPAPHSYGAAPAAVTAEITAGWTCVYCNTKNSNNYSMCKKCGKYRSSR